MTSFSHLRGAAALAVATVLAMPFAGQAIIPAQSAPIQAPDLPPDTIVFYRDPMGGPDISLTPKKDSMGMDFLPVRAADIGRMLPPLGAQSAAPATVEPAAGPAKARVLYYRNPMGLADTSPVPKKDSMGMDYVPVYEGSEEEPAVVRIGPGRIQRTGVRTEPVQTQAIVSRVEAPGSIQLDERRVTVVATRSTAFIDKVADVTTGDLVKAGQPLMRLYSPDIASAAAQYAANPGLDGARTRLANLGVPATLFAEIDRTHKPPLTIVWQAPRDGLVLERSVTDGMKADPGQSLFRLADLSVVWALVDVSERDYGRLRVGQPVVARARALRGKPFAGRVSQIYPQVNRDTRTVRVRVELAHPDFVLRPDMYVDSEISVGDGAKVATVSDSAVLNSGKRQLVILDKGDGRFEPRDVKTGGHGEGRVEIREGLAEGDRVVTSANFLIDSESNLKAALKDFQMEAGR